MCNEQPKLEAKGAIWRYSVAPDVDLNNLLPEIYVPPTPKKGVPLPTFPEGSTPAKSREVGEAAERHPRDRHHASPARQVAEQLGLADTVEADLLAAPAVKSRPEVPSSTTTPITMKSTTTMTTELTDPILASIENKA